MNRRQPPSLVYIFIEEGTLASRSRGLLRLLQAIRSGFDKLSLLDTDDFLFSLDHTVI